MSKSSLSPGGGMDLTGLLPLLVLLLPAAAAGVPEANLLLVFNSEHSANIFRVKGCFEILK